MKNILLLHVLLVACIAPGANGQNTNPTTLTLTNNGIVYSNAQVVRVDLDSITIIGDGSGARIKLKDLPPDLQKRFNYHPATAAAANAEREGAERARRERVAWDFQQAAKTAEEKKNAQQRDLQRIGIYGKILQKIEGGLLVITHESDLEVVISGRRLNSPRSIIKTNGVTYPVFVGTLLLIGYPREASAVDGDYVGPLLAHPVGEYQYTTVNNSKATIRRLLFSAMAPQ